MEQPACYLVPVERLAALCRQAGLTLAEALLPPGIRVFDDGVVSYAYGEGGDFHYPAQRVEPVACAQGDIVVESEGRTYRLCKQECWACGVLRPAGFRHTAGV